MLTASQVLKWRVLTIRSQFFSELPWRRLHFSKQLSCHESNKLDSKSANTSLLLQAIYINLTKTWVFVMTTFNSIVLHMALIFLD